MRHIYTKFAPYLPAATLRNAIFTLIDKATAWFALGLYPTLGIFVLIALQYKGLLSLRAPSGMLSSSYPARRILRFVCRFKLGKNLALEYFSYLKYMIIFDLNKQKISKYFELIIKIKKIFREK